MISASRIAECVARQAMLSRISGKRCVKSCPLREKITTRPPRLWSCAPAVELDFVNPAVAAWRAALHVSRQVKPRAATKARVCHSLDHDPEQSRARRGTGAVRRRSRKREIPSRISPGIHALMGTHSGTIGITSGYQLGQVRPASRTRPDMCLPILCQRWPSVAPSLAHGSHLESWLVAWQRCPRQRGKGGIG